MSPTKKEKGSLSESLREINAIIDWFENQQEVDVEKGLEKIKVGVQLIAASKARLKDIENEFEVVKKELEKE